MKLKNLMHAVMHKEERLRSFQLRRPVHHHHPCGSGGSWVGSPWLMRDGPTVPASDEQTHRHTGASAQLRTAQHGYMRHTTPQIDGDLPFREWEGMEWGRGGGRVPGPRKLYIQLQALPRARSPESPARWVLAAKCVAPCASVQRNCPTACAPPTPTGPDASALLRCRTSLARLRRGAQGTGGTESHQSAGAGAVPMVLTGGAVVECAPDD